MTSTNSPDVSTAFDVFLEEIEGQIGLINSAGGKAFAAGDYVQAKAILEHAGQLTGFRDKVLGLRREWEALRGGQTDDEEDVSTEQHRKRRRLTRGLKTPNQAFYLPILQALVESGGKAKSTDVLDRVEEIMKDRLKPIDYAPKPSDPTEPRWRNAAQWARYSMVKEGLLRDDSPRGTWEISDKGRAYLLEN